MADNHTNQSTLGEELGLTSADLTELKPGDFALVDVLGTFLMGTVIEKRKRESLSLTETILVNGTPIVERRYEMATPDWEESHVAQTAPEITQLVYPVSVHASRKKPS